MSGRSGDIIKRDGESLNRVIAHNNLAEIGELRSQYKSHKSKLSALEATLRTEEEKLKSSTKLFEQTKTELALAQEEIDKDPLPEGAQPVKRVNNRNLLRLVSVPDILLRPCDGVNK